VSFEPEGAAPAVQPTPAPAPAPVAASSIRLRQILAELEGARARLEATLSRSA
jgi:hypothetical protein